MALDQDIASAADSLALQRIQAQDYRDAAKAAAVQRQNDEANRVLSMAKADADRAALAEWRAQNIALTERSVAVTEQQAAMLATQSQERWLELYRMHLAVRLGPAIISSTTPSSVILDVVADATTMTVAAWPSVKAELDKLA